MNKFHRPDKGKGGGPVNMAGKTPEMPFVEKTRKIPGVPGKTQSGPRFKDSARKVKTHAVSEGI